jgi:hypothetical protein
LGSLVPDDFIAQTAVKGLFAYYLGKNRQEFRRMNFSLLAAFDERVNLCEHRGVNLSERYSIQEHRGSGAVTGICVD